MARLGFEPNFLGYEPSVTPVHLPATRASRGSRTLVTTLEEWGNSRYTTLAYKVSEAGGGYQWSALTC